MSPSYGYSQPQGRQLVSQNDRAIIERANVPRSKFIGQWTRKTAFDAGYLVPFLVDEILPGDKVNYSVTAYVRMSTPLFPLFDNQRIDTFFFYVPARLVWDNWTKFMGEQDSPSDILYAGLVPEIINPVAGGGELVGSLWDHMGLPPGIEVNDTAIPGHTPINALPFRCYNLIYRDWFRDQNLIPAVSPELTITKGNGPDSSSVYQLRKRAKSHDYFTSALPFSQKFSAPLVGLTGQAAVTGLGFSTGAVPADAGATAVYTTGGTTDNYLNTANIGPTTSALFVDRLGNYPQIYADLSTTTGVAINTFRQAFMVQSLLERDARGGTRYVELLRSHFGVTNPDFRLQRPEYIGGGQTSLQITPVAQTAPSAGTPVGALGAAATAAGQHNASFAATEHGYIIGIINVRSELSYQQGIHKMYSRRTRYDFYWPALALLGEQAVLRKEIYATYEPVNDEVVFGYQERWQEYRTRYSDVTGIFRSSATGTLDAWHLAQQLSMGVGEDDVAPVLSKEFIEDSPPMVRILAAGEVSEGQEYLADLLINRTIVRPIPMFGTPASLGRF